MLKCCDSRQISAYHLSEQEKTSSDPIDSWTGSNGLIGHYVANWLRHHSLFRYHSADTALISKEYIFVEISELQNNLGFLANFCLLLYSHTCGFHHNAIDTACVLRANFDASHTGDADVLVSFEIN